MSLLNIKRCKICNHILILENFWVGNQQYERYICVNSFCKKYKPFNEFKYLKTPNKN